MAARAINSKNLKKSSSMELESSDRLELGMLHWRPLPIIVCIIFDLWLTLTYFMARSNLVTYALQWKKNVNIRFFRQFL